MAITRTGKTVKTVALIGSAVLAIGVGAFIWRLYSGQPPTIKFVEFRTTVYGNRVAVMRATNTSNIAYWFIGYSSNEPYFSYRTHTPTGWVSESGGWCATGSRPIGFLPHTAFEFDVGTGISSNGFAVGIDFQRGATNAMYREVTRTFARIASFAYHEEPTWSEPIPEAP